VFAIAPSPHSDNEILVGTFFGGLYRTRDGGIQWSHVPSPFSSSTIFAISYDPNHPEVLYVGTFDDGLFKSVDDGIAWTTRNNGLPDVPISDLGVNPFDSSIVLVATENGVFRSTDSAGSWNEVTTGLGVSARTLAFDPSAPGQVFLGTREQGVYRSLDAGQTWAPFTQGMGLGDVNSLGFSASSGDLYAATNDGAFRLREGNVIWDTVTLDLGETPINQVREHPTDGRLFAATPRGVFVLHPAATAWTAWTPRPSRIVHLHGSGSPIYVAALGSEFVATIDDGQTFFDVSHGIKNLFAGALGGAVSGGESIIFGGTDSGVHVASRAFKTEGTLPWFSGENFDKTVFVLSPHPTDAGTVFAGTERAGVWKSTDWGIHWESASDGIVPTRIFGLSQSPVGGNTLYAATNAGLFLSRDDGTTWEAPTGFPVSVPVLDVLADPVFPGVAYVATSDARLYRTVDDGLTFQSISTGLPADAVRVLSAAPFGNIYAVTTGGDLYVSFNEGGEWFPTGSEIEAPVLCVAADPQNPFRAYVGTNGGGVYRSTTNGLTWAPTNAGLNVPVVFSLTIDAQDNNVIYAGSAGLVYKSTDGASQWTPAATGLRSGFVQEIIIDDDDHNVLHAFVAGAGIYSTSNGGQLWTPSAAGDPFLMSSPLAVSHVATGKFFAGSDAQGVYASLDMGKTFARTSDGLTLFVRGLAIGQQQTDVMFAGSLGGGIFRSTDGGENWTHRGWDDRYVFSVAIDPENDAIAYAATSLGVLKTTDGGDSFRELGQKTSVIFAMAVDPRNRDVVYISSSAGNVFASSDAGLTWTRANRGLPSANILALAIDPSDGTLYASAEREGVFKSRDGGASWHAPQQAVVTAAGRETARNAGNQWLRGVRQQPINARKLESRRPQPPSLRGFQVVSLAVADNGALYAAAGDAGIYRSMDGGGAWQAINAGFDGDFANQIVVAGANTLFVAAHNETGRFAGVGRSNDAGSTWFNSSTGLQTESVESITIDPANHEVLYAATARGVYRSTNGGGLWGPANTGLPDVAVTRVIVDPFSGALYAATRGGGVFRSIDTKICWEAGSLSFADVAASGMEAGKLPGTVYLGSLTNGFFRTVDGGDAWLGGIDPRLAEPIVTFLAIHPQLTNVVYASASGVGLLKSTNGGITWDIVGAEIGNPFILAIAIDPIDPETMYVGTTGDGVWVSQDAGESWTALNDGLFNLNVTSLLVDPVDHNVIYVGTEGGGIFSNDRTPPSIDADGDGVFDQEDCAPSDSRLATTHTFYHDYDQDSFGIHREEPIIPPDYNIATAVDVCELIPAPGLVPWTNDPWDFDGFRFIQTQLKGDRILGVDFRTSESGQFPDDALVDLSADAATLHVVWKDVETTNGVFNGPQAASLAVANQLFSQKSLKVSLTISPIVSGVLTVPEDLKQPLSTRQIAFNDPRVIVRFWNLLGFVRTQIPDLDVISVQVGYEIDKLLAEVDDAAFWSSYVEFQLAAREGIRSLWGTSMPVGSTWSVDGYLNPEYDPLREVMSFADDIVSLTFFPRRGDFTVVDPVAMLDQLHAIDDVAYPKPVYFQAVGYPSAPITGSSTTKQSQFLYAFFEFWDQAQSVVRFVSFGPLHDVSPAQAALLAESPEFRHVGPANRARLVGYLGSLGLRTYAGDGESKPAYNTLRNHSFDRGWFRDVPRASRSFYLGFTQTPYDLPPDAPTQIEVFSWMRSHLVTDSDFFHVHLDGGVPWVEAYADAFSSAELPYSGNVRATLQNDRDTIPPGSKVLVSINPLGVPRDLLAPYWGYGQGYDFDEDFNRVPNGIFADADKRALPPPWDKYDFGSVPVRIAFLKYAMRIIDYFQPDYLAVGIEVTAALAADQERYEKYFEMHQWLYEQLKAEPLYANIPIMVSFSSTSFMIDEFGVPYKFEEQEHGAREAQLDALQRMLPYTDIIGLSHYPHFGKYSAYTMPAILYDELFDMLDRFGAGAKPIAITEGGYTADPYDILDGFVYTGTAEKQERHYRLLFRELARRQHPVEFIVNFEIRDGDLGWQRLVDALGKGTGEGSVDFVEFLQFFRDIGLYDGDGHLRPAGQRWRAELALPFIDESGDSGLAKQGTSRVEGLR
jgi:photosystem II stability/assembly factor-like uncharacterized protein